MGCIKSKLKYKKVNQISKYHPLIEIKELSNRGNIFYSRDKRFFLKRVRSLKSLELIHLKKCQKHKNIISIIEILQTSPSIQYIVMKKYDYDFLQLLNDFSNYQLSYKSLFKIFYQIIDALTYCHSKRIVHLDVKLENIMIKSLNPVKIKLIDFGLSKLIPTNSLILFIKNKYGTEKYKAPEIEKYFCTFKSDIFSLGILIKNTKECINSKILNKCLNFNSGTLAECLSKDWDKRPELKDLSFYLKNRNF